MNITSGGDGPFSGYWFKVPAELHLLMGLKPKELKVYLVLTHAIQRDRNGGWISLRQIADRTGVTYLHVQAAVDQGAEQIDLGSNAPGMIVWPEQVR